MVEGLETRLLLYATTGGKFEFGSRITWSIVPDGTNLAGVPSNLIATLDADIGPQSTWLPAIQDAFAEWENVSGINVVQVPDSGQPTEYGNIQQDSPQFGDIRIGGFVESSNMLAFTLLPPPTNGGSDTGDVFLNTGQSWHVGSDYDLETVIVHEIGHSFSLGESSVPNSVMYPYYGGIQDQPNTDDIQGIQSVWGPRQEDGFEQNTDNLVAQNAANVTGFMNTASNQVYLPGLDVASSSESYWFKVTTPSNASNVFTAQVQSTNLSELSPRVQIYNSSLQGLVQAIAPANQYGATVDATITNATPNTTYYIRVLGSNSGASGSGAYAMTLNMGSGGIGMAPPPNTLAYTQPDQGGGGELMADGGIGQLMKQSDLNGGSFDSSALGTQLNSDLGSLLNSFRPTLASVTGDNSRIQQALSAINTTLVGLFPQIPIDIFDGSSTGPTQSSGSGPSSTTLSATLENSLSKFLAELESILSDYGPSTTAPQG